MPIAFRILRLDAARGWRKKLAPNFLFKHGRQQSTKSSYRPVGLGSACNDCPAITAQQQRFEKPREGAEEQFEYATKDEHLQIGLKKRSRPWKHYYSGGFFLAFPKANSGVYSIPNRSARFSNSPRQPDANARPRRGTKALSPRWLSEPGQLPWMSAITGTMIPIAGRCRESVCQET